MSSTYQRCRGFVATFGNQDVSLSSFVHKEKRKYLTQNRIGEWIHKSQGGKIEVHHVHLHPEM